MGAPEKLYLGKNIYSTFMYQVPDDDDKTQVEYICMDAFIEKACKWLKENAYFYVNDYTGSLNDDMLVSEFHKAMKE